MADICAGTEASAGHKLGNCDGGGAVAYSTTVYHATDNSIGSTIEGLSFCGLLARVEIGQMRIGSATNGRPAHEGQFLKCRKRADSLSRIGVT